MARILAPADLRWLIPFPRYGRLKLELVLEQILGSVEGPQLRTDLQGAKQQWGPPFSINLFSINFLATNRLLRYGGGGPPCLLAQYFLP